MKLTINKSILLAAGLLSTHFIANAFADDNDFYDKDITQNLNQTSQLNQEPEYIPIINEDAGFVAL